MDKPTRNRTPLTPEESFKLYLPLGVEAAAKRIFKGQQGIFNGSPEPENEALYSLEHAFRSLLCKLAQVVDNRKGGDTVTSFVALQEYGKTNFLFCSNQRREDDLKDTASFVKSLLVFIRDKPNGIGPKPLLKRVLWRIVLFNVPRIGFYLDALTKALEDCIADCGRKRGTFPPSPACILYCSHLRRTRGESDVGTAEGKDQLPTGSGVLYIFPRPVLVYHMAICSA